MSVFGNYSNYYDLLYKDKDYSAEVDYILGLIKRYQPSTASILTLGCGTGKHEIELANKGLQVEGVDRSEEMIHIANENLQKSGIPHTMLNFNLGDVRSVNLGKKFDSVISLFHVASYQTSNEDLRQFVETAKKHLKKGGLFIFDVWHGPAVLTDKPLVRTKEVENESLLIIRDTQPVLRSEENVVEVNFIIKVSDKVRNTTQTLSECHRMRYLFKPELMLLLKEAGLELIRSEKWMTAEDPSFSSWYVTYIARMN